MNDIRVPMKKTKSERVLGLIDSIATAVCILFAMRELVAFLGQEVKITYYPIIYFLLAVSCVMQAIPRFRTDRAEFGKLIGIAAFYTVVGTVIRFVPPVFAIALSYAAFFAAALPNRVMKIISNHRPRSAVCNGMIAATALLMIFETISLDTQYAASLFLFQIFFIAFSCIGHIVYISFAQMRFRVMMKIIRKTFAAEILFGMVLLIVSFSFVFVAIEPEITSFADAMWYCFAVVTTTGFGDLTVVTVAGRLLSVILGMYGIVVVALITSIIVNFYGEMKVSPEEDSGDTLEADETGEEA